MARTDKKNMAACPGCGRKVHIDVPKCPYCSLDNPFKSNVKKIIAVSVGMIALMLAAGLASAFYFS